LIFAAIRWRSSLYLDFLTTDYFDLHRFAFQSTTIQSTK